MRIASVIWTYNPDIKRFIKCLEGVHPQVDRIVIVDNGSKNINDIRGVCNMYNSKVKLIELGANLGVEALNIGMNYVLKKFNPDLILILDDDTVLHPHAILKALNEIRSTRLYERIGALCLTSTTFKCSHGKYIYVPVHIFSGCIIRAQIIKSGVKIRKEFFLDQADHDFFTEIRRRGYLVIARCGKDLAEHRLGVRLKARVKIPFLKTLDYLIYEPPWRFYYIVRNSTVLVMEGKLNVLTYIRQLCSYFIALTIVDGFIQSFRMLVLGLTHGLFKKLGYADVYGARFISVRSAGKRL